MHLAVIGGGWAGLAAAVEATRMGAQVTLFEAGRGLGGRARCVALDGQRLDNGQHILLGAYRSTLDLMRQVGADPERLLARHPLQVCDNTGFKLALPRLPAPLHVAFGLLGARGVGLAEKLRTAAWMQGVQWRGFRLAADTSVAAWLDAAGQTGHLRRHLWEPLCLAALNTRPEHASAQLFANVLRDSLGSACRADTDLLLPRVDLGQLLPEPAAAWLHRQGCDLRLGRRVHQLAPGESGVTVDRESFDGVILATAPQHAAALSPGLGIDFTYEAIATVYLRYPEKTALPFPLLSLHGKIGQWVVDRGNGLLAGVFSGHGAWEALDDTALADALHTELGLQPAPAWHRIIREKRATFSARPGLAFPKARPDWRTSHPGLVLAGDYTWSDYPATLEGAVRSGQRAARALLAR